MTDYEKKVAELRATKDRSLYAIYDTSDPNGTIMIREDLAWDWKIYYWYKKKDGSFLREKEHRVDWGR